MIIENAEGNKVLCTIPANSFKEGKAYRITATQHTEVFLLSTPDGSIEVKIQGPPEAVSVQEI